MILDAELLAFDEQAVVSTLSSDVIDLGKAAGAGKPLNILAQVTEDFTSGGAATLALSLKASAAEAMTSPDTLYDSGAMPVADLEAGYHFPLGKVPVNNKRYLQFTATVATASMTAGRLTAGVILDDQTNDSGVAVDTDL